MSEPRGNRLLVELTAAANHRPALRAQVADLARQVRRMQIEALESILDEYGIDSRDFPPALVAAAMQGLAFALAYDQGAGFDTAQEEATVGIEHLLDRMESRRRRAPAP